MSTEIKVIIDKEDREVVVMTVNFKDLKASQEFVKQLAERWEEEFDQWFTEAKTPFFESKVLPGLCEGDDIMLEDSNGVRYILTDVWEQIYWIGTEGR